MWEISDETKNGTILPSSEEIKSVLKASEIKNEKTAKANYIVWTQILICGLMLLTVLLARQMNPKLYGRFQEGYEQTIDAGMDLSGKEELIKFANSVIDGVRIKAEAAMAQVEKQLESNGNPTSIGIGAGGTMGSYNKKKKAPEGCSLDTYAPDCPLNAPIQGYTVTSPYGWRKNPFTQKSDFHKGSDLAIAEGTNVHPMIKGIVQKSSYNPSYGNYVLIVHENGVATRYCHMQYVFVRQGERVGTEDVLGTVGQTGAATGPHLHFEIMHNDIRYDPTKALEMCR